MNTKLDQIKHQDWESSLLAISGGVDSICLLHLLTASGTKFEAAYIDHGQRPDTELDIQTIKLLTDKFKVKLHLIQLDLPKPCSEQLARTKRYQALNNLKVARGLDHLITAHHSDDVLETAIINITRGTGPRGLSSLKHQPHGIWRPFLFNLEQGTYILKSDILDYANQHQLKWHEDSTNQSSQYLRNRVRQTLKNKFKNQDKLRLLDLITKNIRLIKELDHLVGSLEESLKLHEQEAYSLKLFEQLPEELKDQFLHKKITEHGFDVNQKSIYLAKQFIQTKTTGKILELKGCRVLIPKKGSFIFRSLSSKKAD